MPFAVAFDGFVSRDVSFAGLAAWNCTAYTEDDETGGFVVTQRGAPPVEKVVDAVDENGAFHALQVEMQQQPRADVWLPVWPSRGLVNVSGPTMVACPPSVFANASAGVPDGARCLRFQASDYDARRLVVYRGVDDGGARGRPDASGASAFRVAFGPSVSNDTAFDGLRDHVTGSVVDNDVLQVSLQSCNTTEQQDVAVWGASEAAPHYGGAGAHRCSVTLSFDEAFFGATDDASLASSSRAFAVVASVETDEGVFALRAARGSGGAVNVTTFSNQSARALFTGGGAATLIVNGTDDDLDDGDVMYPLVLDTYIDFDVPPTTAVIVVLKASNPYAPCHP